MREGDIAHLVARCAVPEARRAERVQFVKSPPHDRGGGLRFDEASRVDQLRAPGGYGLVARWVRAHEAVHAAISPPSPRAEVKRVARRVLPPAKENPIVKAAAGRAAHALHQCVEDCLVASVAARSGGVDDRVLAAARVLSTHDASRFARRAIEARRAMGDRSLSRLARLSAWADCAFHGVYAVAALAQVSIIAAGMAGRGVAAIDLSPRILDRSARRLAELLESVGIVYPSAWAGMGPKAVKAAREWYEARQRGGVRNAERAVTSLAHALALVIPKMPDFKKAEEEELEEELEEEERREMTIPKRVTPPLTLGRPAERRYAARPVGAHVRSGAALARACVDPGARAFRRKIVSGERDLVMLDASGSMAWKDVDLLAACKAAPTAEVRAYCGNDGKGSRAKGWIGTIARGGRCASGAGWRAASGGYGGNTCDLFAVRELLRHRGGRRLLVTDGGFCGGVEGEDERAKALMIEAVARGDITVVRRVSELAEALKPKRR